METNKQFETLGYKITDDSKVIDDIFGIDSEVQTILQLMAEKVARKKNSAIKELHDLIKKYPRIPQFKNLLSVLYHNQGNNVMANKINHDIVIKHPVYLFGKLNLANEYVTKKQFEKVPEILGEYMDIKKLYPSRDEFHVNEVVSFNRTALNYFIAIEDIDAAEIRLDILKKLDENFSLNLNDSLENSLRILYLKRGNDDYFKQRENTRTVKAIAVKVVEPTNEKPVFNNKIIEQLYCNSMRIDHELLKQVLLLPRETLIPDLLKVIYDSIARFKYFSEETEWEQTTHEFLSHALHLLTELNSEESLEVIFNILRQDEEYFEYWFSDTFSEQLWECLFVLGNHKLEAFRSYVFEPNHYCYARLIISETIAQIALYYPERRDEVITWYKRLIEGIFEKENDETVIDTDWIAFIICDLADIGANELIPIVKELFVHGLVSEDVCGDFDEIAKDFQNGGADDKKKEIYENIFLKYDAIVNFRYDYKEPAFGEYIDDEQTGTFSQNNEENEIFSISNPLRTVGRNDPCPCGSGKKFKKCCLDKMSN
jgi:signal peptidase I